MLLMNFNYNLADLGLEADRKLGKGSRNEGPSQTQTRDVNPLEEMRKLTKDKLFLALVQ